MTFHSDPMLPWYTNFCQCAGCGEYFGGVTSFDLHRRGGVGGKGDRRCLPPSEIADREGRRLLRKNEKGYWVREVK